MASSIPSLDRAVQQGKAEMFCAFAAKDLRRHVGEVGHVVKHHFRGTRKAAQVLQHVSGKADLAHLAVADRVDPDIALAFHDLDHRLARAVTKRVGIDGLLIQDVVEYLARSSGLGRLPPCVVRIRSRLSFIRQAPGEVQILKQREAYNVSRQGGPRAALE